MLFFSRSCCRASFAGPLQHHMHTSMNSCTKRRRKQAVVSSARSSSPYQIRDAVMNGHVGLINCELGCILRQRQRPRLSPCHLRRLYVRNIQLVFPTFPHSARRSPRSPRHRTDCLWCADHSCRRQSPPLRKLALPWIHWRYLNTQVYSLPIAYVAPLQDARLIGT